MVAMFLATACASVAIFIPVYFIPLYFQFVRGDTALKAGVRLLPYVVLNVTLAMANGVIMSKKPYYMPWYVFSGAFTTIGSALMYTVSENTTTATIYGYSVILGTGAGGFIQLSFTVIQAKVEKGLAPIATGFCTFAQLVGPAIALAISNTVFLNEATIRIQAVDGSLPAHSIQETISGASSTQIQGIPAKEQQKILHEILQAMSKSYIVSLSAGALTFVMGVFMKRERLFPKALDGTVDSTARGGAKT